LRELGLRLDGLTHCLDLLLGKLAVRFHRSLEGCRLLLGERLLLLGELPLPLRECLLLLTRGFLLGFTHHKLPVGRERGERLALGGAGNGCKAGKGG
jgi:hypothetical protein